MKNVLVVYYSQTGQLGELAANFAKPLQQAGVAVDMLAIQPDKPYPFPWPFWRFFNTFPETVHLKPQPIAAPEFSHSRYDAVVLAYTVWFLSPAQPITAFLQHPAAKAVLRDTPVITLIGCRNMWLMAQETVKKLLADAGAKLVGNIVKIDACGSAASFITTPAWMLSGKKQFFTWLPSAGIEQAELQDAARFGHRLAEALQSDETLDSGLFRGMGAVKVDEKLMMSEKVAKRSFFIWGKLVMAVGRVSGRARYAVLAFYIVFLIGMILTVVPLSAILKRLLAPLMREKLARERAYFSRPSGE
ncbi:hypothetical protein [Neisseria sp. 83E34]|uniref:hypothetical protein n=1 Tax=Neisseria sp. 83E34 TaxID=1692264 RepID=UPI0006CE7116|nr:hypothetical protein [Neisseria sp. 83E34]KPN70894.1 dialkylrecorsinol condensing enzyme [Neisseria sp. 83E34]